MAEWRITAENPVREDLPGLDHERCAALHNLIVERGWIQRGLDPDDLDRTTWWDCFGGDTELADHTEKLDGSLISFLKIAWHGFARASSSPTHAFHRYNARLCTLQEFWTHALYSEDEDDSNKRRFVTLYMANWALGASHPLGLVFDQEETTAIQHISMEDSNITMNGRQGWISLEEILDSFLEMMDQEKVIAVGDLYDGEQERVAPWIMPSYTEQDLEDVLEAFSTLVAAIEARIPAPPQETASDSGFVDFDAPEISAIFPPRTFARRFLERARKPRFTYIAPGLQIAQTQPFAPVPITDGRLRPILLFESSCRAHQETQRAPWGQDVPISAFHQDFQAVTDFPAGLYLTETDPNGSHPFEDGCKLLLSFAIGSNGWARTSDNALFGENKQAHGEVAMPTARSTELFQLGFNHYIESHDVQLRYVLWHWAELVETGEWEIDEDGVKGGLEKWREADTEARWQNYQLPMSW